MSSAKLDFRMLIGVISDTHGLLRPEALDALRGCELILHAGDVGRKEVLEQLQAIAPVTAVRGNVDHERWSQQLPKTEIVAAGGAAIYVLHNLEELDLRPDAAGFSAVVCGHSHRPRIEEKNGVIYFNPGSAGPRRFKLPVSVGRLVVEDGRIRAEIVELKITA